MSDSDLTTRESFVLNSTPIVLKDGILYKKRDHIKGWRPRYFSLDSNFLHYYLSEDDVSPRKSLQICSGIIIRPGVDTKVAADGIVYYPFVISHPETTDSYHLSARSQSECNAWVTTLRDVINSKRAESGEPRRISRLVPKQTEIGEDDDIFDDSNSVASTTTAVLNADSCLKNVPPQFANKLEIAVGTLLQCAADTSADWVAMFEKQGVKASRKAGTGAICVRGETILPYTIPEIYEVVSRRRKELDSQMEQYTRLKWFSRHTGVEYMKFKPVWPTAARDFCNLTHWRLLDNGWFITMGFSEKFDSLCPEDPNSGLVRAELILGGYVMKPVVGGTQITVVVQVRFSFQLLSVKFQQDVYDLFYSILCVQSDLKGTLPASIASLAAQSQPLALITLRKFLDKIHQPGGSSPTSRPDFAAPVNTTYAGMLYQCGIYLLL
jgi:hypothetical protein